MNLTPHGDRSGIESPDHREPSTSNAFIGRRSTLHLHPKDMVLSLISFLSYCVPTYLRASTTAVALYSSRQTLQSQS